MNKEIHNTLILYETIPRQVFNILENMTNVVNKNTYIEKIKYFFFVNS